MASQYQRVHHGTSHVSINIVPHYPSPGQMTGIVWVFDSRGCPL